MKLTLILDIVKTVVKQNLNWSSAVLEKAVSLGYCLDKTLDVLWKQFASEILNLNLKYPRFMEKGIIMFHGKKDEKRLKKMEKLEKDIVEWLVVHAAIDPIVNSALINC